MERPERKESFILHTSQYEAIECLSVEDKAALLDAIYQYAISGEVGSLPTGAKIAFNFIRIRLDEDYERYQKICERNRNNGNKGGRPKKKPTETHDNPENPVGSLETQNNPKKPKETLTDTDTDTDTDTEFSHENNDKDVNTSTSTLVEAQAVSVIKPSEHLSKKQAPVDYVRLCDYWNMMMNGKAISQLRSISKKRQTAVNARIKEHSVEAVKVVIDKAAASPFLNGAGDKAWVASFDWIFLHPTNFQKVLEGNYDDKSCLLATQPSRQEIEKQQRDMGTVRLMNRLLSENEPVQTSPTYSIASVLDD